MNLSPFAFDTILLDILKRRPHAITVGELATSVTGTSTLVARDRVRKSIARLRRAGFGIERVKRGEYRLAGAP